MMWGAGTREAREGQVPYQGETASKASHQDLLKSPDVRAFLGACDYLRTPSPAEAQAMCAGFVAPPPIDDAVLPRHVMAVDGSLYESSIDDQLPSTKVGYVKIGCVLIDLAQYGALRVVGGRYVDPFRVARLRDNNAPLTFPLPSANIRWKGKDSVRDGFRAAVDEALYSPMTRFDKDDPATSLRSDAVPSGRPASRAARERRPHRLLIHACPNCEQGPVEVRDVPGPQVCLHCGGEVYPSDVLRVWEEVGDYGSNIEALGRFMMLVEHMVPMHYLRHLAAISLPALAGLAFFVDGPLAVFGNGAWLHAAIMRYLAAVNGRLAAIGLPPVLMIGLQKTGQVADYAHLIDRYVAPNRLFAIDDEYRYHYILGGRDVAGNGFGFETYYGQDFIFKTPSGRRFVLALPYPFADKDKDPAGFRAAKTELGRYANLPRALALVKHFESDLYENAVVPIALAHRYTAISLEPGGKALDILTRKVLQGVP